MKIALCLHISLAYYGGGEKWACKVAGLLTNHGHEVEIYSLPYLPKGKKRVDPALVLNGVPYVEKWKHKLNDVDIAYIFYHPFSWVNFSCTCPKIAALLSGVYFLNNPFSQNYGVVPLTAHWLHKIVGRLDFASFNAVHILNYAQATRFPHENVYVIPLGVDTQIYQPSSPKSQKFTVLFVGRQVWQKGWDTFLNIASKMKNLGYNFNFVCLGDATNKHLISKPFILDESRLANEYSRAHVCISPSRSETFGSANTESLACGTPVITTRLPSNLSLKLPFFFANDEKQIINRILYLHNLWVKDPDGYELICKDCVEAAQKYDVKLAYQKFESMLKEVAVRR
jgi:glycosyltransferase involved in cell wall biosynthesis